MAPRRSYGLHWLPSSQYYTLNRWWGPWHPTPGIQVWIYMCVDVSLCECAGDLSVCVCMCGCLCVRAGAQSLKQALAPDPRDSDGWIYIYVGGGGGCLFVCSDLHKPTHTHTRSGLVLGASAGHLDLGVRAVLPKGFDPVMSLNGAGSIQAEEGPCPPQSHIHLYTPAHTHTYTHTRNTR